METIRDIENGVTEIGLVGIPAHTDSLHYLPVCEIQDTFVATDTYLKNLRIRENGNKTSLLANANFMMLNKENISRKYVDNYLASHQIVMNNILEINTMDLLIELAKIDLGIACVIRDFVKDDIKNGTFKELTFKRTIPKRKVGFTYREDIPMSDAMKKFISFIEHANPYCQNE
jgi:DNA-binding transcriptional LysR family regulator